MSQKYTGKVTIDIADGNKCQIFGNLKECGNVSFRVANFNLDSDSVTFTVDKGKTHEGLKKDPECSIAVPIDDTVIYKNIIKQASKFYKINIGVGNAKRGKIEIEINGS